MAAALEGDIFFGSEIPSQKIEPSNPEFVTVVTVDPVEPKSKQPFVTILSIGTDSNGWNGEDSEEVLVYRLPGERLGFGLKFDGGSNATEKVSKLMIQSCAPDSPASRTLVSWGHFSPGDEILEIDNVSVTEMTRMECVRSLKESNVQLKLRVRKGDINNIRATAAKQPAKNVPPPVPPRKYPRRGSKLVASSIPIVCPPDGFNDKEKIEREKFNVPEPQIYTDLIAQETVSLGNHESESDDTGSSMSTVVDKQFSTPTTSNSSFSDIRSITSAEIAEPLSPDDFSQRKFDLDKVLEPFLQLEREFSSSATIEDNNDLFQKLVAAATLKENDTGDGVLEPPDKFQDQCYQANESVQLVLHAEPEEPPKPLPRKEIPKTITKYGKKRPPPPPPQINDKLNRCPTPNREEHHESSDSDISVDRLPRLIDFVPKDRVDLIIPSAVHPNPVDMLLERQRILSIVNQEAAEQESSRALVCNVTGEMEERGLQKVDNRQLEEISHQIDTRHDQQKNSEEDAELRSQVSAHECLDNDVSPNRESDTLRSDESALSFSSSEVPDATQCCATIASKKEETSKMEPLLAFSPSVNLNIPPSPPAYSRMPPDGHEFPQNYQELGPNANLYELPSPAVPASEPPPYTESYYTPKKTAAYIDVINEAKLLDVERKSNDAVEMKTREPQQPLGTGAKSLFRGRGGSDDIISNKIRSHQSWRNDEKSERSVKDKIAMFSSAIVNAGNGTGTGRGKHREEPGDGTSGAGISHTRAYSKSIFAMNTVGCRGGERLKSKDTYPVHCQRSSVDCATSNPISIMNRTQSSIDLTLSSSSCSSAYSSCSPDSSLSPMSSPSYTIGSSSTLPRKHKSHVTNGATSGTTTSFNTDKKHHHTSLTRTTSFTGATTLHSRSQSLVDVLHTPYRYGNYEDARKDSLTTLIEQRRRTMSKLRGLVIPEKACESQTPIIDLPEIKSKEVLDRYSCTTIGQYAAKSAKQEHHETYNSSWKSVLNTTEMPKYSPAFKRKTLTVYGVSSSASSLSSSLNSSREELRSEVKATRSPPAKPPRNSINYNNNNSQLLYGPPVYKSLFSNDKSAEKKDTSRNDSYISRNEPACKLQEDSDNDSAVSSSRSSLCQEYSPPSSPSPNTEYDNQTNDRISNDSPSQSSSRTLRRTLSSETNVSVASTISTLTSGSQASCSSNGDNSGKDSKSKRILKAESVEAINRKNVLSSAKYSCGQDFKVGSPLIKDVFDGRQNTAFEQTPKFEDQYADCDKERNWYDYDKLNGNVDTIKVAYLEIQDSEESDFSTKENSSSVDTDDNIDKSLELSDSMSDTYASEYTVDKKDQNHRYSSLTSNAAFTKLEKEVYAQVIKNEDLRKANEPETKISSRTMLDAKPSIHVSDIKKTFEKIDPVGKISAIKFTQNHLRMSSMDSTTSEDSLPAISSSASNLLKEQQFGSITSLASSTSLISQQELQQLIDEANQTLEETAGSGGHDLMVIILHRETVTSSIGITLAGGADYETKEITVHKVLVGSPADKDGRIQKGDRILSINGRNMKGVTHREALSILKAPRSEVVLVVSRWRTDGASDNATPIQAEDALLATFKNTIRPPRIPEVSSDCDTDNFTSSAANNNYSKTVKGPVISVTLIKEGGGLGFSLEGGKDSPFGDLPLTIKKIFTGGCAAKSGMLFAGDELLSLNGVDVTSMSRTEAWNMMKRLSDGQVVLGVRKSSKE